MLSESNKRNGLQKWALKDLNLRPMDYESTALTAELRAQLPYFQAVMVSYFREKPWTTTGRLDTYHSVAADLHAGRQPSEKLPSGAVTVKDICNQYLTYQLEKAETNEIQPRTFAGYRKVIECFANFVGPARAASSLTPKDFQQFRNRLSRKSLAGKRSWRSRFKPKYHDVLKHV